MAQSSSGLLFVIATAFAYSPGSLPPSPDYCARLEQESQGLKAPFIAGKKGALYIAGQSLPGGQTIWPIIEHETIGFTHAFFHDGRARGEAIVSDELTGTGHSLWGWEFWRNTRIAYGTVVITHKDPKKSMTSIANPAPTSLRWRPDRITAIYDLAPGLILHEVKFITADDVLVDTISLTGPSITDVASLKIRFAGSSYVNTRDISTQDGDPPNTPQSQERNSVVAFDHQTNQIHLVERGTGYAKTTRCSMAPLKFRDTCKARVGPMMYDGMSVVLSATQPMQEVSTRTDKERRRLYNFTLDVPLDGVSNVSLSWAMDDDADSAKRRTRQALAQPAAELARVGSAINHFLHNEVPRFASSDERMNNVYYFTWAIYYMYFIDTGLGFEKFGHAQTAVNNFLGLHAYDSRVYIPMGSWVSDLRTYAYGNALTWSGFRDFIPVWKNHMDPGVTGDNIGHKWICPVNCSAVSGHPEGVWQIYQHGGSLEDFLRPAYDFYNALWGANGSGKINPLGGIGYNNLAALAEMATHLGQPQSEIDNWAQQRDAAINYRLLKPPAELKSTCSGLLQMLLSDWVNDSWAAANSPVNTMDKRCWQNDTVPLKIGIGPANGNFAVSTIVTYWSIEGLFRHNVGKDAVALTLAHIEAMLGPPASSVSTTTWDDRLGCACNNPAKPITTNNKIDSHEACQTLCGADPKCLQWMYRKDVHVCWTYAVIHPPGSSGTPFDCGCRGSCGSPPRPPPGPHPGPHPGPAPRPPTPSNFIAFPEAWDQNGHIWGDQYYNWDGVVSLLLLERLAGVSYSVLDTESVFTVRDFLPPQWSFVNVSVPVRAGGAVHWVDVAVTRTGPRTKSVRVANSPLANLTVEVWLEGKAFASASPPGYNRSEHDRVSWRTQSSSIDVSVTVK